MMRTILALAFLSSLASVASAKPVDVPPPPADLAVPEHPHHISATPETVQQVLAKAKCGDWIELSGEFPAILKIYGLKPSCPVVIDGSKTTLSNLTFAGASNWIVQGSKFGPTKYASINVTNSDHISVRDSTFDHIGLAAMAITTSNHVWATRNHVEATSGDGFDIAGSQFIVVSKNVCANNISTPTHPDCVQAWDIKGKDLVSDIWITDNEAFGPTQGFDGFDHGDGGFDRVYVVGNKISTTMVWAGAFNACRHCIMAGNRAKTLQGQPHGWGGARWVMTENFDDKKPTNAHTGTVAKDNENGLGL